MSMRSICLAILFVLLVAGTNAGAVSSVTIVPTTANGDVYTVSAADVYDAAGIDFSFSYDTATLANPTVAPGQFALDSNALVESNTSTPGFVRVVFITSGAFKGTGGQLAKITFAKVGKLPGRIFDLKPVVYSTSAAQVAAQPIISSTTPAASDTATTSTASATPTNNTSSASGGMSNIYNQSPQVTGGGMGNIYNQAQQQRSGSNLGSVTSTVDSPAQQSPRKENLQRDEPRREDSGTNVPQETAQSSASPATIPASSSVQTDTVKSPTTKNAKEALALLKTVEMPAQRFKSFKGMRSVKGLVPLFDAGDARKAGAVQIPEIAVSDGNKMVTVRIELAAIGMVPNFSLKGANLKSIRPITDKVWELDALPQKGKSDVQLSVLLGSEQVDIPLVVIPPLDDAVIKGTQELAEKGVDALLAKAESKSGKLAYDLNNDRRQDFLDDYILVGHYLLKMQKNKPTATKK